MRLLIFLALLGAACAYRPTQRVVGGVETSVDQYPYMSNMQYLIWGIFWQQSCGGSLISNTYVLSAAHCFEGDSPSSWRVRLGTSNADSNTDGEVFAITRIILHERYNNPASDNDVALIRLARTVVYGALIQSIPITSRDTYLPDGTPLSVIGWGSTSSGGPYPEILRTVEVNIINQDVCAERYDFLQSQPGFSSFPRITPGMLCAGILDVGGADGCQGDSGGPVVFKQTPPPSGHLLTAVTSWGYGCAHPVYPGVNARVSFYADWIVANAV